MPPLFAAFWHYLFGTLMFVTSIFLILLILIQRGRGGGLAGALGGMGGQSAFGTKAGDLFTRVTMIVATFWILLCVAAIAVLNGGTESRFGAPPAGTSVSNPGEEAEEGIGVEPGEGDDVSVDPTAPAGDASVLPNTP